MRTTVLAVCALTVAAGCGGGAGQSATDGGAASAAGPGGRRIGTPAQSGTGPDAAVADAAIAVRDAAGSADSPAVRDAPAPDTAVADAPAADAPARDAEPRDGPLPVPLVRQVFVSRVLRSGNLGGLAGAHQACQREARVANLTGTFKAWLSDATSGPAMFMTRSMVPYALVNGTVIARNWLDLTDGTLMHAIDRDEDGQAVKQQFVCEGGEVWSNTTAAGLPRGAADCGGWRATAGTSSAGNVKYADGKWSDSGCTSITCASALPLYCFEQ